MERLLELLAEEKEAERDLFAREWLTLPLGKRRELGITLYPVELDEARLTLKDRWRLSFRVSTSAGATASQFGRRFSVGQNVEVFGPDAGHSDRSAATSGSGEVLRRLPGVIAEVGRGQFVVICDDSPDWLEKSGLGLDLAFSETTYRAMEAAVRIVLAPPKTPEGRMLGRLRDRLLGAPQSIPAAAGRLPSGDDRGARPAENFRGPALNPAQKRAVVGALRLMQGDEDFMLIHGPPGTGKTTTLVASIHSLVTSGRARKVLVTAPTNAAVDLLTEKLLEQGLGVLRLGHPARVEERLWQCTLEGRADSHEQTPVLAKMRHQAESLYKEARRFRRRFGPVEAAERRAQLADYRELRAQIRVLEKNITQQVLDDARIILATLVGAGSSNIRGRRFDVCCIDEASQALEPASWIPMLNSGRVILAGDHQQLPPVVKSGNALQHTLFEKIIERHTGTDSIFFLDTQYRMAAEIMAFPNAQFYGGRLRAHSPTISRRPSTGVFEALGAVSPFVFVDTAGTDFLEIRDPQTESCRNEGEARLIKTLLARLEVQLSEETWSVGVIAAYRDQAELMRHVLDERLSRAAAAFPRTVRQGSLTLDLEVDTVDSFQGRERDAILISLVRSNELGETGFLSETRRMNVALTRARRLLIVVGDSATLSFHPFYERFLEHAREHGDYRSAYEFME